VHEIYCFEELTKLNSASSAIIALSKLFMNCQKKISVSKTL
jgi:hypothetical protein